MGLSACWLVIWNCKIVVTIEVEQLSDEQMSDSNLSGEVSEANKLRVHLHANNTKTRNVFPLHFSHVQKSRLSK